MAAEGVALVAEVAELQQVLSAVAFDVLEKELLPLQALVEGPALGTTSRNILPPPCGGPGGGPPAVYSIGILPVAVSS